VKILDTAAPLAYGRPVESRSGGLRDIFGISLEHGQEDDARLRLSSSGRRTGAVLDTAFMESQGVSISALTDISADTDASLIGISPASQQTPQIDPMRLSLCYASTLAFLLTVGWVGSLSFSCHLELHHCIENHVSTITPYITRLSCCLFSPAPFSRIMSVILSSQPTNPTTR
jgi:hypothetical protein